MSAPADDNDPRGNPTAANCLWLGGAAGPPPRCTACGADFHLFRGPPGHWAPKQVVVCDACGHAMALGPDLRPRDLTRAEAAELAAEPSQLAKVRRVQEDRAAGLWG